MFGGEYVLYFVFRSVIIFLLQDPSKFVAAPNVSAAAAAPKEEEPAEESDEDMGLGLFD